ncbi:MAG TPA: PKD domain-containing protein [Flavitalea sp.]|nr:PKD domain-containing protein [Flavitalea sp.]
MVLKIPGEIRVLWLLMLCLPALSAEAQNEAPPYFLNGQAYSENCNCYTLTPDARDVSGSVWNVNKINLNQSFDFKLKINLGCNDDQGADGIAFVLQNLSTNLGITGGGMGYLNIAPSVGIAIDTWQNTNFADPPEDHITIHTNGNIDHQGEQAGLTATALPNGGNIEDCKFHAFRVTWDASTRILRAEIDGVTRVQTTINIVDDIFSGDPMVFWGFTGGTGIGSNRQRICTALDPHFYFPEDQVSCYPEPFKFLDSSQSFSPIDKWHWDFGDGTTADTAHPPPHVFPAPGEYEVKLSIHGSNGCQSDTLIKKVISGSKPVAGFRYSPTLMCDTLPVSFFDSSIVDFGTITSWNWTIEGKPDSTRDPGLVHFVNDRRVSLTVGTQEGCTSDVLSKVIPVAPPDILELEFQAACVNAPAAFQAINKDSSLQVVHWLWDFGDGEAEGQDKGAFSFEQEGVHPVKLKGILSNGCTTEEIVREIQINKPELSAGNDTIAAPGQPVQLSASGAINYNWSPGAGLDDPASASPVATNGSDVSYVLSGTDENGCTGTDTVNIRIYNGPNIYVPSAFTPNGDGKNDKFTFIAAGISSIELFQVYNRYGQLVYTSSDLQPGWDGRMNGTLQPSGTYVWMVRGRDFHGQPHFKKGTVTLIR